MRKKYYLKIKNFTYQDFWKIVFSDESSFKPLNTRGGQTFFKNAITQTGNDHLFEQKSLEMVWWFTTGNRKFKMCFVDGSINSDKYISILKNYFFGWNTKMQCKTTWCILSEINASCHVSKKNEKIVFRAKHISFRVATPISWP